MHCAQIEIITAAAGSGGTGNNNNIRTRSIATRPSRTIATRPSRTICHPVLERFPHRPSRTIATPVHGDTIATQYELYIIERIVFLYRIVLVVRMLIDQAKLKQVILTLFCLRCYKFFS